MKETQLKQSPGLIDVTYPIGLLSTILSLLSSLLLLGTTLYQWYISLGQVDLSRMNDLGLVSVLPLTFFVALAVLTISFMLTLSWEAHNRYILLLHILVLIFILHGTPQILYGTLRYSWAWKHVGIVDYIQRNGSVNPKIHNLNAYHNWPGFFALAAFFNGVGGLQSSLSYAGWGPVFFNLLDLGALLMILKNLTNDRRLIWLSAWFFYLSSWVGQDYFSPQAMTYFLYFVALAIVLTWFRMYQVPILAFTNQWLQKSRIANLYRVMVSRAIQENKQPVKTNSRQRVGIMATLIMIFIVIASSHQLTPLMAVSALSLLVFFQMCSERYLPVLMVVLTVSWVLFMAVGFLDGNLYWVINSIGSLFHNVNATLINLDIASPGQQFIAFMDRGLSASVWVLGFLGFLRRYRAGHWDLPAILLTAAPLPMLGLNSYGGEMLFRVYLFSLPFVTFFAASLLYPHQKAGLSFKTPLLGILLSFSLFSGFVFAYYGKERMYHFTPNEVAAAQFVYSTAPKGSLLVDGTWNWPRQSVNYEDYNYLSIAGLSKKEILQIINNPAVTLYHYMDDAATESDFVANIKPPSQQDKGFDKGMPDDDDYPAAYFIVTRSQLAETEMTGMLQSDWLTKIIGVMLTSDRFQVVFSNPDAIVFKLVNIEKVK